MRTSFRTWPYGTTRRGKVMPGCQGCTGGRPAQFVRDEQGEMHVLFAGAQDLTAKVNDSGTLTFTQGGPTGGYWKFKKD